MEIRQPQAQDLDEIKHLWACCFETEEEPFFQWFFSERYCAERALGVFDHGQLRSALHIVPYTVRLRDADIPAGYLLGVATYPEYRQQGCMAALLTAALAEMRQRRQPISLLLPRRPSIYTRHGWEVCYHTYKYQMPIHALPKGIGSAGWHRMKDDGDLAKLDTVYRQYMKGYHGYVLRSETNWRELITENTGEGGELYLLELGGSASAYVMFIASGSKLLVKEMAYCDGQARSRLFSFLGERAQGYEGVDWQLPVADPSYLEFADERTGITLYPFTSGRIVDIRQALACYKPPAVISGKLALAITDTLAPWNQGIFSLAVRDGILSVDAEPGHPGQLPDVEMTIGSFSQLFFGYAGVEELMLTGRLKATGQDSIVLLKQLFPCTNNVIYENF